MMTTNRRTIFNDVSVSGTVRMNVNKTVQEAEEQVRNDEKAINLMKKLRVRKELGPKLMSTEKAQLEKLIKYGLVNVLVSGVIVLSEIGNLTLVNLEH
jgi:hypothetical protein